MTNTLSTSSTENKTTFWVTLCLRWLWILPLSFYWTTVSRVPGWVDGPMIADNCNRLLTGTWVNIHNLFHIVGRLWTLLIPWGDLHFRLNLLSGIFGALTVHFVFVNGFKMTRNPTASLMSALAVMLGHSLWWHSTNLEVYTLNTVLIGMILFYILRYQETGHLMDLYKTIFIFGLGLENHILMGLFGFGFITLSLHPTQWRKIFRPMILAKILFVFGLALQIFLFIFLKEFNERLLQSVNNSPHNQWFILKDMINNLTGGHFKSHMFPSALSAHQKWNWRVNYFFLLLMNYPSVAFLAGFLGLYQFSKRKDLRIAFLFFITGLTIQFIWSSNYLIWDMYAFALPVWVLFGMAMPLGFDFLLQKGTRIKKATYLLLLTFLIGPYIYSQVPKWDKENGFWRNYFSYFDYVSNLWDASLFFGNPNKMNYRATTEMADIFFRTMPIGAHIYDDDGKGQYPFGLYYQNVLKQRLDIHIHPLWGPDLTPENIRRLVTELLDFLQRGERVFVSSPFWPERAILNETYKRLSLPQQISTDTIGKMTPEELEKTFPKYSLVRIPMSQDGRYYIYELRKRIEEGNFQAPIEDWIIEGEDLNIITIENGSAFPQDLNGWSAGKHLLWLDSHEGDSLHLQFFVPQDMSADLLIRYTTSYDFGRFQVSLDGEKISDEIEGYSKEVLRSNEVSLGQHSLLSGHHILRITMTGNHIDAKPRYGFGLDYLHIRGIN